MPKVEIRYGRRQSRKPKTRRENDRKDRANQAYFRPGTLHSPSAPLELRNQTLGVGVRQLRDAYKRLGLEGTPVSSFHEVDDFRAEAGSIEFESGEYFEWERYPDTVRLAWSARTNLVGSIAVFRAQFGEEVPSRQGVLTTSDAETTILPASEIAQLALSHPDDVRFYRIDYDDAAVTWNPPTAGAEYARFPEARLATWANAVEGTVSVLQKTATPSVAKVAAIAVHLISEAHKG